MRTNNVGKKCLQVLSLSFWIETIIKSRALTIYQQKMFLSQIIWLTSRIPILFKICNTQEASGRWQSSNCWLFLTRVTMKPICFYLPWCCKETQNNKPARVSGMMLVYVATIYYVMWSSDKKRWWKTHQ